MCSPGCKECEYENKLREDQRKYEENKLKENEVNNFPKVVVRTEVITTTKCFVDGKEVKPVALDPHKMEKRGVGEFKNKGIYLSNYYSWKIVVDSEGTLVLIAEEKYN